MIIKIIERLVTYCLWAFILAFVYFLTTYIIQRIDRKSYIPRVMEKQKNLVLSGHYNECIEKAVPIGNRGKIAQCSWQRLKYGYTLYIVYDSTGEIGFKESSFVQNGIYFMGQPRSKEWHETADKLGNIFQNSEFYSSGYPLGNHFYYVLGGIIIH